jgi:hypothetical protein
LKKLLTSIACLLMAVGLHAQTTTYTGVIRDLALKPVTSGQVTFTLAPSTDSTLPGTGRFTPSTVTCSIKGDGTLAASGSGVGACVVASNTALSPTGTSYRICIQPQFATPGSCFYDDATGGSKDISTVAPTLQTGPLNYNGVPGPPGCVIGTTCVGALTPTPLVTQAVTQPAGTSLNVNILNNTRNILGYGAKCDGSTDDTPAFQLASDAAKTAYTSSGGIQTIVIPSGKCVVAGQVIVYSGQYWTGQGTVLVPTQTGHTFYTQNSDNVTFDGINITVTTPMPGTPDGSAIAWYSVSDSAAHKGFYVRNCHVINSSWGILAYYSSGTGSLSDVDISNNTVTSTTIYTNGDGIHAAGRISGLTIHDNRVINRGDAGIGLTSEVVDGTTYTLSGAKVSNNVLLEDLVGLDNSGATNVEWSGNYVRALTSAAGISNPAFRSISYPFNSLAVYSVGVHVFNNYLYNGNNSGHEHVAVFNPLVTGQSSWPFLGTSFEKNVIDGPNAPLYVRGNGISVGDNTFIKGGDFAVDYDGVDNVGTANVLLGTNKWLAAGSMSFGAGCALYSNISLQPQATFSALTYSNLPCIGAQAYTIPGALNTPQIIGPAGSPIVITPGTGAATSLSVTNPAGTANWFIVDGSGNANVPIGSFNVNQNLTVGSTLRISTGVTIGNTNLLPQVGTPTVGQATCVKSAGPPVVIGYCSTVVSAGGACTCN